MKYVIYQGDDETIICTKKNEKEVIKTWFTDCGRDVDEFDRTTSSENAIAVSSDIHVRF